jgi:coproporphyrinogen III oxidase
MVCGGQDLTPLLFEEDAIHFHQTCKQCDKHNLDFIQYKQCDAYF